MLDFERTSSAEAVSNEECLEISVRGNITQATLIDSGQPFHAAGGTDVFKRTVILNLEQVEFIDSSGIGWLLTHQKQFRENEGHLVLHSLSAMVQKVFGLMKLSKVFTVAESRDDALVAAAQRNEDETRWEF
ncbi:MAG: STAS domain-containing protein [Planctomycetota bacterium]